MLFLNDMLAMRSPLRLATLATTTALLFARPSHQQTYTKCDPTVQECPPDTALGRAVNVDFASGQSSEFTTQSNVVFDSDGAHLTVAASGDAPQLNSNWYIMFGHVEVVVKAAPGAGIVSSVVLQSDDLDEIDWEWLGAAPDEVQSNYFGKGQTTSYDRAAVHAAQGSQTSFHTYTIDWTHERIVWQINGQTIRVLEEGDAHGQFPQTPCQFKIGAWSGGDPGNPQGTIDWSRGPTDYSQGPFTMVVQSASVIDYSTGEKYSYGDRSGTWGSIISQGGQINANAGAASGTDTNAPQITSTSSGGNPEPFEGTHRSEEGPYTTPTVYPWVPQSTTFSSAVVTNTNYPGLPSGWTVSSNGKVVPPQSAAPSTSLPALSSLSLAPSATGYCFASGYKIVTSYDVHGFLVTATVAEGISAGYDDRGFPTTIYPANCPTSNYPMAAGEVLQVSTIFRQQSGAGEDVSTSSGRIILPTDSGPGIATTAADSSDGASTRRLTQWATTCSVLAVAFAFAFALA